MKIRTIAEIAGILIVIGVLGASGAAYHAFQRFKVGGPVYGGIVLTKDLVSDILPPPEYIVEGYLEATLALNDPANAKEHAARIAVLEKDYGERHRYWEASPLEVSLKQRLTRGAHQPAEEFWTLARQSFFPALERADIAAARDAYGRMTRAYFAHRAQIDNVVTEANRLNAATEQAAATDERRIEWKILVLLATVVSLILASGGKRCSVPRPPDREAQIVHASFGGGQPRCGNSLLRRQQRDRRYRPRDAGVRTPAGGK